MHANLFLKIFVLPLISCSVFCLSKQIESKITDTKCKCKDQISKSRKFYLKKHSKRANFSFFTFHTDNTPHENLSQHRKRMHTTDKRSAIIRLSQWATSFSRSKLAFHHPKYQLHQPYLKSSTAIHFSFFSFTKLAPTETPDFKKFVKTRLNQPEWFS